MTDYTKTTNFTAKDSLPSGDSNKKILGALFDTEFDDIETAVATKANMLTSVGATNNLMKTDVNGDLAEATSIKDDGTDVSIATGRNLKIVDNGGLYIAATQVTSTAPELNLLDGVTTLWHSGNDGAGSGLDSDLLDGQHGSYYLAYTNFTGTVPSADLPAANTTTVGALETATQAEVDAETATDKIVTPSTLGGWANAVDNRTFTSSNQTITAGGNLTIPHGLGAVPNFFTIIAECQTAEYGYSVGDKIVIWPNFHSTSVNNYGLSLEVNSTNLIVEFGTNSTTILTVRADTNVAVGLTNANWQLIFIARL